METNEEKLTIQDIMKLAEGLGSFEEWTLMTDEERKETENENKRG